MIWWPLGEEAIITGPVIQKLNQAASLCVYHNDAISVRIGLVWFDCVKWGPEDFLVRTRTENETNYYATKEP